MTDSQIQQSVVLSAQLVSKAYRRRSEKLFARDERVAALHEVSMDLYSDETLAIIGDSGSGKTTLTRILMGLIPPSSGEVFFRGKPLSQASIRKKLRAESGVIFQNPSSSLTRAGPSSAPSQSRYVSNTRIGTTSAFALLCGTG